MIYRQKKHTCRNGFTLIELMITVALVIIPIMSVALVMAGGNRTWHRLYQSAYHPTNTASQTIISAFGTWGRKANRSNYVIYKVSDGSFTPALPETAEPTEVVFGEAVEFRYWDEELQSHDSTDLLDVNKTATAYALFYLEDEELKIDYGAYPPAAVTAGGNRRTAGVETIVIAEDVSSVAFSHTTMNGVGQGSVRIKVELTHPDTQEISTVMTSTLMRNVWPK